MRPRSTPTAGSWPWGGSSTTRHSSPTRSNGSSGLPSADSITTAFGGRQASHPSRGVLAQLDGWFDRLLAGYGDSSSLEPTAHIGDGDSARALIQVPMLALARSAGGAVLNNATQPEVRLVSWPVPAAHATLHLPKLLGGAGIARLALGDSEDAFDIELRSLDAFGPGRIQRQTLRVAVGGRPVLGDLDELPDLPSGFDRAVA